MPDTATFWTTLAGLRREEKIPRRWAVRDLLPHMRRQFSENSVKTIPYNQSVDRKGTIKGNYVKKGAQARAYRVGRGTFELIEDPAGQEHLVDVLLNSPFAKYGIELPDLREKMSKKHPMLQYTPMPGELIFEVTQESDGGYCAECLTESIFTQANTWDELRANIVEAVDGHFFDGNKPSRVRLHLIRDEVLAVG